MAAVLDPYLQINLDQLNQALQDNQQFLAEIIRKKLIKSGYDIKDLQLKIML